MTPNGLSGIHGFGARYGKRRFENFPRFLLHGVTSGGRPHPQPGFGLVVQLSNQEARHRGMISPIFSDTSKTTELLIPSPIEVVRGGI